MNEGLKDKGLKRAIKEQPQFRLSTNFTFRRGAYCLRVEERGFGPCVVRTA